MLQYHPSLSVTIYPKIYSNLSNSTCN